MFSKELRTNRRGQQIAKARTKNGNTRSPWGRKDASDTHQTRVANRGKITNKRAKTADSDAKYDLIDLLEHHMSMV